MTAGDPEKAFLKTLHLLYVEDDPVARDEISGFLARWVGTMATAEDGAEGLAAFKARPADIVVTDIRMPRLDGLAMAREIRNLDPGAFIIVTTAYDDWDGVIRSIAVEVDQYVLKPLQRAHLEFALLSCARHRRLPGSLRISVKPLDADETWRLELLTPREREVLARIGRGQSSREIGLGLGISAKTVHAHQANLMIKLGLHKGTALAAFAVRAGIL